MVLALITMGTHALSERHQKRKASRQPRCLSPEEMEPTTTQPQPQPQSQPQSQTPNPTTQRTRNPAKRLFSKSNNNNNRKSISGAFSTRTTTVTSITPFTIQDHQECQILRIPTEPYESSEYSTLTTLSPYSSESPSISSNFLTNASENMPFSPDDVGRQQTPVIFRCDVESGGERMLASELQGDSLGCSGKEGKDLPALSHICAWSPEYGIGYLWSGNEGQSLREEEEGEEEKVEGEQWDRFMDEVDEVLVQECVVRPLVLTSSPRLRTTSTQRRGVRT